MESIRHIGPQLHRYSKINGAAGRMGGMTTRFDDVADDLRAAYAGGVELRESMPKTPWKPAERAAFGDRR